MYPPGACRAAGSKLSSSASALLLPVLSFSLFLLRKQRKTTLWGDWFHAPERPKQKGWARVPLGTESVLSRAAGRHTTS
jgi:hypothetical protein